MGVFDVLGKIVYGAGDFMATAAIHNANRLDRMTDEEIERGYSKPADEVRMDAEMLRSKAEILKMKRDQYNTDDDDYFD